MVWRLVKNRDNFNLYLYKKKQSTEMRQLFSVCVCVCVCDSFYLLPFLRTGGDEKYMQNLCQKNLGLWEEPTLET